MILRRRLYIFEQGSCPVRTKIYGGISTGGGYGSSREYEIGAQRMAEAVHCILGSLGRHLGKNSDDWKHMVYTEAGHLTEEMGIVENVLKEYSRDIYINQVNGPFDDYKPQYRDEAMKYSDKAVKSLRENSKKLRERAKSLGKELIGNRAGMPRNVLNASISSYAVLVALADAMESSVKQWPKPISNGFKDPFLRKTVRELRRHLDKVIGGDVGPIDR